VYSLNIGNQGGDAVNQGVNVHGIDLGTGFLHKIRVGVHGHHQGEPGTGLCHAARNDPVGIEYPAILGGLRGIGKIVQLKCRLLPEELVNIRAGYDVKQHGLGQAVGKVLPDDHRLGVVHRAAGHFKGEDRDTGLLLGLRRGHIRR